MLLSFHSLKLETWTIFWVCHSPSHPISSPSAQLLRSSHIGTQSTHFHGFCDYINLEYHRLLSKSLLVVQLHFLIFFSRYQLSGKGNCAGQHLPVTFQGNPGSLPVQKAWPVLPSASSPPDLALLRAPATWLPFTSSETPRQSPCTGVSSPTQIPSASFTCFRFQSQIFKMSFLSSHLSLIIRH